MSQRTGSSLQRWLARPLLADHLADLAKHPEKDPRPRYGDGTPAMPDDWAHEPGVRGPARVAWFVRTADVPVVLYAAVLEGTGGTVPLSRLRLVERSHP